jgi:hypothetical protein
MGPVRPMFCAASPRRTNDVPTHTHHKPTESFSRGSLPLLTSYTSRSTSRGRRGGSTNRSVFYGEDTPRSEMDVAQDRGYADFEEFTVDEPQTL